MSIKSHSLVTSPARNDGTRTLQAISFLPKILKPNFSTSFTEAAYKEDDTE